MTGSRALLSALLLLLALRLLAMVWLPLTDPTEARYAEIARKMAETGNWIMPQFDYGVPFWAKPPLHTWLSALGIAAFGPSAFSARLGILLTSIATLAILWHWLAGETSRQIAGVIVLVTASTLLFFGASAFVMTDMCLTLGVVACMAGFWGGLKGKTSWGWLFFLGLAIGLMAKGPVATVLSLMPILGWMVWCGGWRDLGRLPWAAGLALVAALVVPWYATAEFATPGFLRYFLIGEHIQRFLQPGWQGDLYGAGRQRAKGMIWLFWLAAALPWSVLLPSLIWRLRRRVPEAGGLTAYLLAFALGPLILFSPAANVLVAYVLPGLPAAAALAVLLWTRSGPARPSLLAAGVITAILAFAVFTGLVRFSPDFVNLPEQSRLLAQLPAGASVAVVGKRSFSAEFATKGKIRRFETLGDFAAQAEPGQLVLIPDAIGFTDAFAGRFLKLGHDRRYTLFQMK